MSLAPVFAVPFYATPREAFEAGRMGSNLRCNRCGSYGADWLPGERPGWGSLALCPPHADELRDENRRHEEALRLLRKVNYEQTRQVEVTRWSPQCDICGAFVAQEAVIGGDDWSEAYCPKHGGPDKERVLEIRRERAEQEHVWLRSVA